MAAAVSEYLRFIDGPSATGRTRIVSVRSRSSGDGLGQIRWFGRWRQYCFYPAPETIFNHGCLEDINAHIKKLMTARGAARESTNDQ